MDRSPASISFDVEALGNMEYRIDWETQKENRNNYIKFGFFKMMMLDANRTHQYFSKTAGNWLNESFLKMSVDGIGQKSGELL